MTGQLTLALALLLVWLSARSLRRAHPGRSDAQRLFDAAPIATLLLGADDRIAQANDATARLLGEDAAPVGRGLARLIHADDLPLLRIALAQLRHGVCSELGSELRLLRGGAGPVAVSLHAAMLGDDRGPRGRVLVQLLDVTERKHAEARLRRLAEQDPLTGLLNRRRFAQELERHAAHASRYGADGAVILLDVDRFKSVNDRGGHGAGDRLLVHVAKVLRARLRVTDVLARLGGDEFAILLPHADRAAAEAVARSLVATVRAQTTGAQDGVAPVTISVGVAMVEGRAPLPDEIVAAADRALYAAKHDGRDRHAFAGAPRAAPATIAA